MHWNDAVLLEALHEGMFQQPLWYDFLEKLRVRMGALYTTLIFRTIDENTVIELFAGRAPPAHIRTLFVEKYVRDPLAYRHMREGRVYALEELVDPDNPVHRGFKEELLLPLGMTNLRSVRVSEPGGVEAWLGCAGGPAIGAAQGAVLTALVPHLRIALRTFVAFERERFRSSVTSEAFGRLNFGWLTLDAKCRVIDMTPHVERLLERTMVLRRGRYDRLFPANPAIDRELTRLVKHYAIDPASPPKAINLSRDPQMDMLLAPLHNRSVSASSLPVAIAYLSGDRSSRADRCEQLAELFGLLPSEARFAWALTGGLSIAEAAAELGLTLETGRHYSKNIYAKTGARGQAELVRNILTSVLAIA